MKPLRFITRSFPALVLVLANFVLSARANTLTLTLNPYSNGNGLGGGSYTAQPATPALLSNAGYAAVAKNQLGGLTSFETFCLEYGEHFSNRGTYNYSLSNAATAGSGGAVSGQDPVSLGTAWLYSQFATGTLAGFDYGAGRANSNNFLQLAIWFFDDETAVIGGAYTGYGTSSGNIFLNAAVTQFSSVAGAKANSNGQFGVQVLNLTSKGGTVNNQSQLYFSVTDNGAPTALLGLALVGFAAMRRKFVR